MNGKIEHSGIIEHIDGKHIKVRIVQSSACSSCQAKAICSSSESKEKVVDIYVNSSENYAIGEQVNVCASETMGRNAVILAFVIPLIVMIICITLSIRYLMINELISIAISLMFLALYYWILSISKKRISKKFSFWIEKP
jgi:sigma-E factor negative regulatory protein RseC